MSQDSLSHSLHQLLEPERAGDLTIVDIFERIGDKGFGVLLCILALPSALPLPAAGYSTPFGILLSFLGIQMLCGKSTPWLPQWALQRKIENKFVPTMLNFTARVFSFIERFLKIKPRFSWISDRWGLPFMGALVLIMAVFMIFPIPFTNTFPGMVIFLIGLGLSEDDGLFAGVASILGVLTVLLYSYLIYLVITIGTDILWQMKAWFIEQW